MSDSYTERAERVLRCARRDALSLGQSTVDTPHIYRAIQLEAAIAEIDWLEVGRAVGDALTAALMAAFAEEEATND